MTTNHQETVEWVQHASATASGARLARLRSALAREHETAERFVQRFLEPPVWTDPTARPRGGTLYTAVYTPTTRRLQLRWPGVQWEASLDAFPEGPVP